MLSAFPGDPAFYLAAIPAVILLGLSKGGFSGLSSLAMPLFALAISPVKAAAIVLPILIVQDWVSVWAFRRDFDLRNLAILAPAGAIGVAAGWLLAARVDEQAVRLAVGLISVGFVVFMLLRDRLASRRGDAGDGRARPVLGRDRRLHQLHQPHRRAADDGLHAAAEADAAASSPAPRRSSSPSSTC